ncbi:MAG: hypothetical protein AAF500_16805 [Myxococcota bacterium]
MTRTPKADAQPPAEREPYEAPRIIYREPLEAVATACTAATSKGNVGACPVGPISS